jgi:hypothetical protein
LGWVIGWVFTWTVLNRIDGVKTCMLWIVPGTVVGCGQWLILRTRFGRATWWIPATIAGWAVFAPLSWRVLISMTILNPVGSLFFRVALPLLRFLEQDGASSMFLRMLLITVENALGLATFGAVCGAIVGAVTGGGLVVLLSRSGEEGRHPGQGDAARRGSGQV